MKESCQRCIKIRTPQLERAITILSQRFPDFEVLGHDLIRIFHCNEQSGEINTLLVHSGIEVSEIWLGRYGADRLSFENDRRCKE